jgi:hypothetical protein
MAAATPTPCKKLSDHRECGEGGLRHVPASQTPTPKKEQEVSENNQDDEDTITPNISAVTSLTPLILRVSEKGTKGVFNSL